LAVLSGYIVHRNKFTRLKMQPSARDMMEIGQKEDEVTLDELFSEMEVIDILCRQHSGNYMYRVIERLFWA